MKSNRTMMGIFAAMALVLPGLLGSAASRAEERTAPPASPKSEFFMISSVDAKTGQIVLKRPTEVTELIQTSDKTVILNGEGKKIPFKNLRAGDTVWVVFRGRAQGARTASEIRKGPMTVKELHRRYLEFE